ncbi:MAG: fatty acid desaturase, partial [Myxococcales bacterium]|nr:fatty acid desaturase [Myxococcales bacterium]
MKGIDQIASKKYAGSFAWPTLILALSLAISLIASISLCYLGLIPLWFSSITNFILCYVAFTPLHEAVHNNIRGSFKHLQWIENLVGHLSGTMLLGPFRCFGFLHLSHHAHTNDSAEDPDAWVKGKNFWSVFWRCLTIIPHYYVYFFTSKKSFAKKLFLPTVANFIFLILLIIFLASIFSYKIIFFGWVIPSL